MRRVAIPVTSRASRRRQRGAWRHAVAPALALVAAAVAWFASRADTPPALPAEALAMAGVAAPAAGPAAPGDTRAHAGPVAPFSADGASARQAALLQARQRLARAQASLEAYKASTRYPYDSRPAAEHRDQMNPHTPIASEGPLRMPGGGPVAGLHVRTTQERVFVSGSDSSRFTVTVVDDNGVPQPMRIVRSVVHAPDATSPVAAARAPAGPPSPIVSLPFTDDGAGADEHAADGTYSAQLTPSAIGFAAFPGTIRTELTLQVGDNAGYAAFDIVYAPNQPATWTGRTREALEAGSLSLYLGANVQQAGRYVITGRVDDATGKPFALVSFNDDLGAGPHDVKLTVFGQLVRDQKPVFPLTLRDVDGFLLKQDTFPDRDLMPRLDGPVMTTRKYTVGAFAEGEWHSEEKDRYLGEYQRDVAVAQGQVDRLALAPVPPAPPPMTPASGP